MFLPPWFSVTAQTNGTDETAARKALAEAELKEYEAGLKQIEVQSKMFEMGQKQIAVLLATRPRKVMSGIVR